MSETPTHPGRQGDGPTTVNVLLVEDNPGDARLIREILKESENVSFAVEHAACLQTGLERLREADPHVVLLDLSLPDSQGLDTLARTHEAASQAALIVLTGLDDEKVALEAVRQGAQDYLVKGQIDNTLLVRAVRYATERKQAEKALQESQKQLMQSEKMACIGQLAAGVAHEINNPVGFVMSNMGTLVGYVAAFKEVIAEYEKLAAAVSNEDGDAHSPILTRIEEIRTRQELPYIMEDVDKLLAESADGAERIRDIIQNLRSFARTDEGQLKEVDINQGIEATLKIVWNELKYKCNVHKKLGDIPRVQCYPGRLNQVFMNVLVNAAQAIEERGDITIETEALDSSVVIRIADTGRGIRPEHLSRIFDPFFTTKGIGKGTGLGLSISHGIIESHNGTIHVQSQLGKGTTFTIRLPIKAANDE